MKKVPATLPGYALVIFLVLIPLTTWATLPSNLGFHTLTNALVSLGQICSLTGAVLFSLNFVLSSRAKWLEKLFGSMDKVYIAHHTLGGLAFCFLLFHPILVSSRYVTFSLAAAATLLLPNLKDLPTLFGILALWSMVIFLVITFYFFKSVAYQRWKFIHQLLGFSLASGLLHAFYIPNSVFFSSPFIRYYILSVMCVGLIAFVYRVILGYWLVKRLPFTVNAIRPQASATLEISMKPAKEPLNFLPGQFIFLSFADPVIGREWHPFSITSVPGDKELSISVKELGDYTRKLVNLQVGTGVKIEGPYGAFTYSKFGKRQIWIAGGIGITPFLSMIRSIPIDADYEIDLFYSVRSESEAAYLEELRALVKKKSFIKLTLSATDKEGFLTAERILKDEEDLSNVDFLLCGPPVMMDSLTKQLKDLGVRRRHIHSEIFSIQ